MVSNLMHVSRKTQILSWFWYFWDFSQLCTIFFVRFPIIRFPSTKTHAVSLDKRKTDHTARRFPFHKSESFRVAELIRNAPTQAFRKVHKYKNMVVNMAAGVSVQLSNDYTYNNRNRIEWIGRNLCGGRMNGKTTHFPRLLPAENGPYGRRLGHKRMTNWRRQMPCVAWESVPWRSVSKVIAMDRNVGRKQELIEQLVNW